MEGRKLFPLPEFINQFSQEISTIYCIGALFKTEDVAYKILNKSAEISFPINLLEVPNLYYNPII